MEQEPKYPQYSAKEERVIRREALGWHETLRSDDSEANRAAFLKWLKQSPTHVGTYLEVTALIQHATEYVRSRVW